MILSYFFTSVFLLLMYASLPKKAATIAATETKYVADSRKATRETIANGLKPRVQIRVTETAKAPITTTPKLH